jgi:peptide/nickel transport system substrate-binding protein
LIQANLNDVGFDCQIKAQARAPWYEDNYKGATHGPLMFLRSGDYDGLFAMFHSSLIGKNFNFAMLNDPEVDAALEQGRAETDPTKRRELYLTLVQKLNDMGVAAPLILLAKSPGSHAATPAAISSAKGDRRVLAMGLPLNHSPKRRKFKATAVIT